VISVRDFSVPWGTPIKSHSSSEILFGLAKPEGDLRALSRFFWIRSTIFRSFSCSLRTGFKELWISFRRPARVPILSARTWTTFSVTGVWPSTATSSAAGVTTTAGSSAFGTGAALAAGGGRGFLASTLAGTTGVSTAFDTGSTGAAADGVCFSEQQAFFYISI